MIRRVTQLGAGLVLFGSSLTADLHAQSLPVASTFVDATPTIFGAPIDAGDVDGDGASDYIVRQTNVYGPNGVAYINSLATCACVVPDLPEDVIVSGATGLVLADYRASATTTLANAKVFPLGFVNADDCADYLLVRAMPMGATGPLVVELIDGATHQSLAMISEALPVGGYELSAAKLLGDVNSDGFRDIAFLVRTIGTGTAFPDPYVIRSGFDLSVLGSVGQVGRVTQEIGDLGDVDQDGVSDYFVTSNGPLTGSPVIPGQIGIYSGAYHLAIFYCVELQGTTDFGIDALAVRDLDGDGKRDVVVGRGGRDLSGAIVPRTYVAISSACSLPIWTIAPGPGESLVYIRSVGDANGDGENDLAVWTYSASAFRIGLHSEVDGSYKQDAFAPEVYGMPTPHDSYLVGDLNGDAIADELRVLSDPTGNHIFTCQARIQMGTQAYGASTGTAQFRYDPYPWEPREGTLELSGISSNASALIAVSLAPDATTITGTSHPLHVSLAPADLLILAPLVADSFGRVRLGASLNVPQIAGTVIYLQMAETGPVPAVSNGLELLFGR